MKIVIILTMEVNGIKNEMIKHFIILKMTLIVRFNSQEELDSNLEYLFKKHYKDINEIKLIIKTEEINLGIILLDKISLFKHKLISLRCLYKNLDLEVFKKNNFNKLKELYLGVEEGLDIKSDLNILYLPNYKEEFNNILSMKNLTFLKIYNLKIDISSLVSLKNLILNNLRFSSNFPSSLEKIEIENSTSDERINFLKNLNVNNCNINFLCKDFEIDFLEETKIFKNKNFLLYYKDKFTCVKFDVDNGKVIEIDNINVNINILFPHLEKIKIFHDRKTLLNTFYSEKVKFLEINYHGIIKGLEYLKKIDNLEILNLDNIYESKLILPFMKIKKLIINYCHLLKDKEINEIDLYNSLKHLIVDEIQCNRKLKFIKEFNIGKIKNNIKGNNFMSLIKKIIIQN